MLPFSRAFIYGGIFADHVAVEIGNDTWVHEKPFPGGTGCRPVDVPGLTTLLEAVKRRGSIDPAHWKRIDYSVWQP